MADTQPKHTISRALTWWFRIALTLSSILTVFLIFFAIGLTFNAVNENYRGDMYSYYMLLVAAANALCALFLVFRKNISGAIWTIVPCVAMFLCTIDIGLGKPAFDLSDLWHEMPFFPALLIMIVLLSQIPYLKKLQAAV